MLAKKTHTQRRAGVQEDRRKAKNAPAVPKLCGPPKRMQHRGPCCTNLYNYEAKVVRQVSLNINLFRQRFQHLVGLIGGQPVKSDAFAIDQVNLQGNFLAGGFHFLQVCK